MRNIWSEILADNEIRAKLNAERDRVSAEPEGRLEFFTSEYDPLRIPFLGDMSEPYNAYARQYLNNGWAKIIQFEHNGKIYRVAGITARGASEYNKMVRLPAEGREGAMKMKKALVGELIDRLTGHVSPQKKK